MLGDFIFSLDIVMPIFLVMCIGYVLKKNHILNDGFVKAANTMIFNAALPIKLFYDVSQTSLQEYFDLKFIGFIVVGTILSVVAAWLLGEVFLKSRSQLGAFVQGAFRGNFLYIGLSLMENITGSIGLKAPLAVIFIIPLYNALTVIILSAADTDRKSGFSVKNIFLTIGKNPLIIGVLLGIIISYFRIDLPVVAMRTMSYFKAVVTPLALITIGASFNLKKASRKLFPVILASGFKLIILPLITVVLAIALGFNNEDVVLVYVLFGVPTAIVSYIMTAAMNGDEDLASNIIVATTLLSVITMTLFIFTFKTLGIVN